MTTDLIQAYGYDVVSLNRISFVTKLLLLFNKRYLLNIFVMNSAPESQSFKFKHKLLNA